jgi:hypothetical protein
MPQTGKAAKQKIKEDGKKETGPNRNEENRIENRGDTGQEMRRKEKPRPRVCLHQNSAVGAALKAISAQPAPGPCPRIDPRS